MNADERRSNPKVAALFVLFGLFGAAQDGTATLTGTVRDSFGRAIPRASALLTPEGSSEPTMRVLADKNGVYRFSGLRAGTYNLRLASPGFQYFHLRLIQIEDGEHQSLPVLPLEVGMMADCGGHAVRETNQLLSAGGKGGNLRGMVREDKGDLRDLGPAIGGIQVKLLCATGKVCGVAKTDSNGVFRFDAMIAGQYSILVGRTGFYPLKVPGFQVAEGIESIYFPIYIEHCPRSNCDPRLRLRKPIVVCE